MNENLARSTSEEGMVRGILPNLFNEIVYTVDKPQSTEYHIVNFKGLTIYTYLKDPSFKTAIVIPTQLLSENRIQVQEAPDGFRITRTDPSGKKNVTLVTKGYDFKNPNFTDLVLNDYFSIKRLSTDYSSIESLDSVSRYVIAVDRVGRLNQRKIQSPADILLHVALVDFGKLRGSLTSIKGFVLVK